MAAPFERSRPSPRPANLAGLADAVRELQDEVERQAEFSAPMGGTGGGGVGVALPGWEWFWIQLTHVDLTTTPASYGWTFLEDRAPPYITDADPSGWLGLTEDLPNGPFYPAYELNGRADVPADGSVKVQAWWHKASESVLFIYGAGGAGAGNAWFRVTSLTTSSYGTDRLRQYYPAMFIDLDLPTGDWNDRDSEFDALLVDAHNNPLEMFDPSTEGETRRYWGRYQGPDPAGSGLPVYVVDRRVEVFPGRLLGTAGGGSYLFEEYFPPSTLRVDGSARSGTAREINSTIGICADRFVWIYEYNGGSTPDAQGLFFFEYSALDVNGDIGDVAGVDREIQFRALSLGLQFQVDALDCGHARVRLSGAPPTTPVIFDLDVVASCVDGVLTVEIFPFFVDVYWPGS